MADERAKKVIVANLYRALIADADKEIADLKQQEEQYHKELQVRKQKNSLLKTTVQQKLQICSLLKDKEKRTLERLNEKKVELLTIRNNLDPESVLWACRKENWEKLLKQYNDIWEEYYKEYENFPLSKIRHKYRVDIMKKKVEIKKFQQLLEDNRRMYEKRAEICKQLNQRKIVSFCLEVKECWRRQGEIKQNARLIGVLNNQLTDWNTKLRELEKKREEWRRIESSKAEMPPPKADFSYYRSILSENETQKAAKRNSEYSQVQHSGEDADYDSLSINSLMINEIWETPMDEDQKSESLQKFTTPMRKSKFHVTQLEHQPIKKQRANFPYQELGKSKSPSFTSSASPPRNRKGHTVTSEPTTSEIPQISSPMPQNRPLQPQKESAINPVDFKLPVVSQQIITGKKTVTAVAETKILSAGNIKSVESNPICSATAMEQLSRTHSVSEVSAPLNRFKPVVRKVEEVNMDIGRKFEEFANNLEFQDNSMFQLKHYERSESNFDISDLDLEKDPVSPAPENFDDAFSSFCMNSKIMSPNLSLKSAMVSNLDLLSANSSNNFSFDMGTDAERNPATEGGDMKDEGFRGFSGVFKKSNRGFNLDLFS